MNKVVGSKFREPAPIKINDRLMRVKNSEHLRFVSLGISLDLFPRKRLACDRAASGVTNHSGKISDQENYRMSQVLKVLQFADKHCMPKMQVRRSRIEACFHPQRLAGF